MATGISGAANPDATEEDLYSFRLRCQVLDYSDPATYTPGPPVFGPEQQTDAVGADGPPATEVDCPDGTVLTGLRVGLKGTRYVASAGALCSPVTVNAGEVSLGGTAALAGTLGNPDPAGGVTDLNCPTGSLITGFRGADHHGGYVDALRPICRLLFDDGGIGIVDQEGSWGGKPGKTTEGPFRCASGAVATGIAGTAEADYYEENLVSFRLICRSLNFPTVTPSEFNLTWPTALTVGANSTTASAITATGQDRWFRFPVQPGSRVTVELSDLPADYDLTLFKDIEQAFTTLTSTEDLVKLSRRVRRRRVRAVGLFAVGVQPVGIQPVGVQSVGVLAVGLLPVRVQSLGVQPVGVLPVGLLAVGVQPVRVQSFGLLALGLPPVGVLPVGVQSLGVLAVGLLRCLRQRADPQRDRLLLPGRPGDRVDQQRHLQQHRLLLRPGPGPQRFLRQRRLHPDRRHHQWHLRGAARGLRQHARRWSARRAARRR